MRPHIIITLVFIFLVTTAVSCPVTKKTKVPSFTEFRTGIKSVELDFMDTIPEYIPEGELFKIGVNIKNLGAAKAESGQILLRTDTKTKILSGEAYELVGDEIHAARGYFELEGKSLENPSGEETILFFNAKAGEDVVFLSEHEESEITATLCYRYDTYAVMDVCIDPRQYIRTKLEEQACEIKEITSSGQGGPLAVSSVTPSYRFEESKDFVTPTFEIIIENKGKGTSYWFNDQECGSVLNEKEINRLKVFAKISTGQETLICKPKTLYVADEKINELAVLRDGKAEVICKAPPISVEQAAHLTPLFIHLIYGYMHDESTTFKILNKDPIETEMEEARQSAAQE